MSTYRCSLNVDLIEKVNEMLVEDDNVFSKYKEVNGVFIWNKISALLSRLVDLTRYLNSEKMVINTDDDFCQFTFMELINYAEQINTFVTELSDIFNLEIYKMKTSKRIFPNIGNEISNDDRYIKYLRSLVSIHPTNTDRHTKYGYQSAAEYSPYVRKGSSFSHILILGKSKYNVIINREHELEDQFVVRVYHSEVKELDNEELNELNNMLENNAICKEEYESLQITYKTKSDTYIFIHPEDIIEYISERYNILYAFERVLQLKY
ncbi:hypothetical protein [Halalkalibacter akibai]|uniref:Uncharacterized protein n=1 Tax=Halalkalibacter akibai (strain ATCC 43226 / DSM 21942 / CIP 109018 / JCM 9157 / 1139) TaxID=1236973 RepID=W4QWH0_HALA3|nr:hypothetical protein [Halalkalibacter akibai]GAE36465.1 hypothetical protein JCM9157_3653 [Halalkalibacter akibai JCM 9157]